MSCKLSPQETICMICQSLFSGGNQKTISKCRLLKYLPSMLSVKERGFLFILVSESSAYQTLVEIS